MHDQLYPTDELKEPRHKHVNKWQKEKEQVDQQPPINLTNQYKELQDQVREANSNYGTNQNPQNNSSRKQVRTISKTQKRNLQQTTVILGDSMVKGIRPDKIGRATGNKVYNKSFPGSTVGDMNDYMKPSIRNRPSNGIIHL